MLDLSCDQFSNGRLFDVIAAPPETIAPAAHVMQRLLVVYQIQLTSFSRRSSLFHMKLIFRFEAEVPP